MPLTDHVREMMLATSAIFATKQIKYRIHVITGDRRGAGTDANVFIILRDLKGTPSSVIQPKTIFSNDHEKGRTTTVELEDIGINPPFASIEVWRDNFGNVPSLFGTLTEHLFGGTTNHGSAAWFLDRVEVEVIKPEVSEASKHIFSNIFNPKEPGSTWDKKNSAQGNTDQEEVYVFPVRRWIDAEKRYLFDMYDCVLPKNDPRQAQRKEEMEAKKQNYKYTQNVENGPAQIATLPSDEKFSDEYFWTFATDKLKYLAKTKFIKWTTSRWESLRELRSVYKKSLGQPECMDRWNEDTWFGLQRLQGVNPVLLKLCKEIPQKFNVTNQTLSGLIKEKSIDEAIEKNKLFICDLEIVDNLKCNDNHLILAAPIALFYLNKPDELLPVAIQLQQMKGPLNPVFTPKDPPSTWNVAKMFYNNAEAQHHQGVTHLGFTHLLMEGVCICTHRNLSPSHPIFKLIAPHFLFLLAINSRGLEKLLSPGGWVSKCTTVGVDGMFELIIRGFSRYNLSKYGNVEEELKSRGVYDPDILPYYPYRDDAILLYRAISDYVRKVVVHHYDSVEQMIEDWELKEWRLELSKPKERGGVGLNGIPGDDEFGFTSIDDLIETVTVIIATCSLGHSAANFQQYEQYAYVPNYPGILMQNPPTEKVEYSEADILSLLPNMEMTLDIMVITKLLSNIGTNNLGNFEMQYLYDPIDVQAAEEFRKELQKVSLEIKRRNVDRRIKFPFLDPEKVPNAISI